MACIRRNCECLTASIRYRNTFWWRNRPSRPCWCSDCKTINFKNRWNSVVGCDITKSIRAGSSLRNPIHYNICYGETVIWWNHEWLICPMIYWFVTGWGDASTRSSRSVYCVGFDRKNCCNCVIFSYIAKRVRTGCLLRDAINGDIWNLITGIRGRSKGLICPLCYSHWSWGCNDASLTGWCCDRICRSARLCNCEYLACESGTCSPCVCIGVGWHWIAYDTIPCPVFAWSNSQPGSTAWGCPGTSWLCGDRYTSGTTGSAETRIRLGNRIRAHIFIYFIRIRAFNGRIWIIIGCSSKIIGWPIGKVSYSNLGYVANIDEPIIITACFAVIDFVSSHVRLIVHIPCKRYLAGTTNVWSEKYRQWREGEYED